MSGTANIDPAAAPSGPGCAECTQTNGWWLHLRRCAACGHVGCCDSSPGQHATGHFHQTGHEYVQSFEPGEEWFWSFREQHFVAGSRLAEPRHHPIEQPTPGPAGRVPDDWQENLH